VATDSFTATGQRGIFESQAKADSRFKGQVQAALDKAREGLIAKALGLSPDAPKALEALFRLDYALIKYDIRFKQTLDGNAGGGLYQRYGEVHWNPNLTVTVGGVASPPYITLLHETIHAIYGFELRRSTVDFLRSTPAGPMSNLFEVRAMEVENLARPFGSPPRTIHDPSKTW
jgi:hypothetical protein